MSHPNPALAQGSLAAVFHGPKHMTLERLTTPQPQSGELLVRVTGCTLCGSDLHSYEGRRHVPQPSILGHEIVGEIVSFGEHAPQTDLCGNTLAVGDNISWAVVANCGHCFQCLHGLPQKCAQAVKYGHEAFTHDRQLLGGLAEHCLLVAGTQMVRWPANFPLSIACPASCATATSVAALSTADEVSGPLVDKCVVVFGAGMLGLTTCALAHVASAAHVICVDPVSERRRLALRFGGTAVSDIEALDEMIRERTDGRGADLVIEMSGAPKAFELGLSVCRTGGCLVLVGSVFPAPPVPVAVEQIVRRCLRIAGIHNYGPNHLAGAAKFLIEHGQRFPFAELVADWYPLTQFESAIAAAAVQGHIRIGINP